MRVVRVFWHDGETSVVIGNVSGQPSVGLCPVVDSCQTPFLDQPILQGLVGTFHTNFCLWAVGVDAFDTQLSRCPRELGFRLRVSLFCVDTEDSVFVAILRGKPSVR